MQKKAFVLLSGGLDSTTCLFLAREAFNGHIEAISVDYGQRHLKEARQAEKICDMYNISHNIIDLRGIMSGPNVMLTSKEAEVPNISYDDIKGVSPTYVPFRNGTMLSVLTAHAQKYVMSQIDSSVEGQSHDFGSKELAKEYYTKEAKDLCAIYFGAHAEDAHNWAYPDCTPEFIGSMANAIYVGTYFTVRLYAPFSMSSKADIVRKGTELGVPYGLTWSCYKGEELHCGTCPTCRARKSAFIAAEVTDPTEYADEQLVARNLSTGEYSFKAQPQFKENTMSDTNKSPGFGTPVDQFMSEEKSRTAILNMQRRVAEINDFITVCRKDNYEVKTGITPEGLIQVAIELPKDSEPIRG